MEVLFCDIIDSVETRPSRDIEIIVPYLRRKETISNSRYHWNCWERGKEPFVILQWTLSGEGIYDCDKGRLPVPAHHAFIAVAPERSSYYYPPDSREPWVFSWLNFYGSFACDLFGALQAEFGPVVPLSPRGAAAASLRRLLTTNDSSKSPDRLQTSLQAYAFVLEWRREAAQPSGSPEDRLARAMRFSREHFREPLSVKQLASEAAMSREHFSRLFSQRTGETPAAHLQRLRLNEAEILIRDTDLPLREIAMRSGFYSERHLLRTFQRIHRLNPSQYRRRKRK